MREVCETCGQPLRKEKPTGRRSFIDNIVHYSVRLASPIRQTRKLWMRRVIRKAS
jgi:hypothetical protein